MNKNIIRTTAITIGLTLGTMVTTAIGYLILGSMVGSFISPNRHTHEYACACDEPPLMTELQATILGAVYMIVLMTGLFILLRELKFSKWERIIALIILLFANLYVCSEVKEILSTQVTG